MLHEINYSDEVAEVLDSGVYGWEKAQSVAFSSSFGDQDDRLADILIDQMAQKAGF